MLGSSGRGAWQLQSWLLAWWRLLLALAAATTMQSSAADSGAGADAALVIPNATLLGGLQLPLVGFGCSGGVRKQHVLSALKAGYRHFDTAQKSQWGYNEADVGEAVVQSGLPREQLFLQTKIAPEDLGYEATTHAFQSSLSRLRTSYVDSLLIHKPRCWEGACTRKPEGTWQESYRALEDLHNAGSVRAIGICDVDDRIMNQLLRQRQRPHVIQNYMDPYHQDKHIRERCKKEGIQYQAYSMLGTQWVYSRRQKRNPVFSSAVLSRIASNHNRTLAQVVLNWAVRLGVAVLPSSKDVGRQRLNMAIFDFQLSEDEMRAIEELDGALERETVDGQSINLVLESKGADSYEVFYVDDNGKESKVGDVGPGEPMGVNTYDGHMFRAKIQGHAIEELVVDGAKGPRQRHVLGRPQEL